MKRLLSLGLLGALFLAACASSPVAAPEAGKLEGLALTPRPLGSPDVVVLAVSGRCGVPCSEAPEANENYLEPRGTVAALADTYRAMGLNVQTYAYSAHLTTHYSSKSGRTEQGFLQMEARLKQVVADWVTGRSNPARIVLLGHSHGTNWTHNLVRAHPAVRFDTVIDLDGICYLWEDDNSSYFARYYAQIGYNPWPTDLARSCDVETIAGDRYSAKDVAYPNVRINLEVQSKRIFSWMSRQNIAPRGEVLVPQGDSNFAYDYTDNLRLDGSRTGIYTFVSRSESHSRVSEPDSAALNWVRERVRALR
ncbi:hypothetical protein HNR42_000851 [Deinobacterium chartae]|uniref:Alpha/beta hydrolase family protein n=1 Tax=Deinobacterium chartae TaxID=521158 RepID=A0A841HXQ8_9DEIO|nr:hypothetical protein [Deinobacterium chartae]MBB6097434.1 hypothetical protein [Deinobacterium chartae]